MSFSVPVLDSLAYKFRAGHLATCFFTSQFYFYLRLPWGGGPSLSFSSSAFFLIEGGGALSLPYPQHVNFSRSFPPSSPQGIRFATFEKAIFGTLSVFAPKHWGIPPWTFLMFGGGLDLAPNAAVSKKREEEEGSPPADA